MKPHHFITVLLLVCCFSFHAKSQSKLAPGINRVAYTPAELMPIAAKFITRPQVEFIHDSNFYIAGIYTICGVSVTYDNEAALLSYWFVYNVTPRSSSLASTFRPLTFRFNGGL